MINASSDFSGVDPTIKHESLYKGVSLKNHYKGKSIKNKHGECYIIKSKVEIESFQIDKDCIKQKLLSDLKTVSGISFITESNLRREGINSVVDLKRHYRYCQNASDYCKLVDSGNAEKLYEVLSNRFSSTNPILFYNSTMFNPNKIAFIDIETLGLSDCPLFLIGVATFQNKELIIEQIFARNLNEEKSTLQVFANILKDKHAIGSFNGKTFDVPFIRKRMERHDLKHDIHHPHFDFLYFSQKAFNGLVNDFRLTTIEKQIFADNRINDVPGSLIPSYYTKYLKTNNIGAIVSIIDHNKKDLITTAKIFMKLHEIWN